MCGSGTLVLEFEGAELKGCRFLLNYVVTLFVVKSGLSQQY